VSSNLKLSPHSRKAHSILALALIVGASHRSTADDAIRLVVPYVKQPEALCGGAAATMVFKYWGDEKADVRQFVPLVDRKAGGIATDVLAKAIEDRAWRVVRFTGSLDSLADRLRARQPVIVLLEDRPHKYHYVVAIGLTAGHIVLHDPARGPARLVRFAKFRRSWEAAASWALLVLPADPILTPTPEL